MASFNKVILLGNLTRDPELRHTPNGKAVCDIGLAMNKKRKGGEESVCFVDVTLWDRTAEVAAEYLTKGRQALIEGELTLDQWQDKESGKNRSKLKVTGHRLTMVGGAGSSAPRGEESQEAPSDPFPPEEDEIPF